jgi:peptide/nickel transport system substrate-binding protein
MSPAPVRICLLALAIITVLGCGSPSIPPSAGSSAPPPPPQRKTVAIGLPVDFSALAGDVERTGAASRPTQYMQEFVNAYMTVRDHEDQVAPNLAAAVPSVEAGSWRVFDDGRMEVTWQLRSGWRWHDGTEVTAGDVAFAWEVARTPAAILGGRGVARFIDRVETPDAHTVVFHWRQTSYRAGELGISDLEILPRHLLEEALRADAGAFPSQPHFTDPAAFVGAGPYRPVEWERGSHLVMEAFDGYYFGRAAIDRIVMRIIPDSRTTLANLLAGQLDMVFRGLSYSESRILAEEWGKRNGGTVLLQPDNWRQALPQLRPEVASPADLLNRDVRKALLYALEREQLAEAAFPGAAQVAHSGAFPESDIGRAVDRQVVKYAYDPTRAARLLADAGWARGGDGTLTKGGNRFHLELQATGGTGDAEAMFPVMQQQYKQVGIDIALQIVQGGRAAQVDFSALSWSGLPVNSNSFAPSFHSAQIPSRENRFSGSNDGGYVNPAFDRVADTLDRAVRREEVTRAWADGWQILSDDVAVLPMFYFLTPYVVRQGITGPLPSSPLGARTFKIHEWNAQ